MLCKRLRKAESRSGVAKQNETETDTVLYCIRQLFWFSIQQLDVISNSK